MILKLKTPAKVNLGLHIHGKRQDGFHELETIFQMVSLYDDVELELLSSGIMLECDTLGVPADDTNLVYKAALLLQKSYQVKKGVSIRLKKKIPFGAGLGGGSGNAAGVLMGLNRLWSLNIARENLFTLAAELGSDVPFFLTSPCALGMGRGEQLKVLKPCPKFQVLLVFPGFPIATSWVYQNLRLKLTKRPNNISILRKNLSLSDITSLGLNLYNDLEPVVIQRFPEVQVVKDELQAWGALGVLLCGSGSTVFGIFDDSEKARVASAGLNGDWERVIAETIENFDEFFPEEILNYP
ncbi:MAG: 4-(cytidine 5'-diphospho)-2-C-methyl-D-erythritol kinase [Nitrospina sp.]|jgi:4-diphosphocytidyl-2-C-methyl-D-erythritol kinase|nr:4-(cytidine 5'-diphospho)-2-C-methyl-D-erythritol kinase [Nitrospina sp.]MBT6601248.1 4-(cytidine 5'-diphospho)-2-C-methyl-D-erythritol kinase [Nitrospina sp.]